MTQQHPLTMRTPHPHLTPARAPAAPATAAAEEKITHGVTDVAFSATGRIMFASYDENKCRAWETISKEGTYHELDGHKNRVSCLGVNSTGQALCTGSWDTELTVWA